MQIETIEEWNDVASNLAALGYRLWQWQFDISAPEGLHVWFCVSGRPDVELVTHSLAVSDAILRYGRG